MKVSASRRERCRINQEIYRKRHADNLDEGIRTLQEEIQELETHHHNAIRRAPMNESVWIVATEYFRLFRYGYMAPIVAPQSLTPPSRREPSLLSESPAVRGILFEDGEVTDQDAEEDEAQKLSSLGAMLLNQRLSVDLMTPMLQLLGSLEDVARVFDKALVTLDGRFLAKEGVC
ncbi:hypothetical protein PC118_g18006 [Phytophthora cactorum]|uniref:Uncharacterized protein n=2 Tax=Phytophthora cactorum TaxID=29920 RepID=A0A8T1FG66_9STRA|nr:hypothetical protein PC111_g15831 [Phytophthora cactorum]KAG2887946.1 hypothetical protein PC114_g18607 [Phytophthora cactorum]KAG2968444.1 hypothetical protein PC118_g18006 [Phytophthora cactorum]